MHIVMIVIGLLAGLGFWWYRIRAANNAANEVVDAVGRVRGSFRRKKIRNQNRLSPLTAIDDPVIGGATVLAALVMDDVAMSGEREAAIRSEIGDLVSEAKADEAVIYGKWAAEQIDDASLVIDKVAPFLAGKLYENEKHGLMVMAGNVVEATGPELPMAAQRLRRLRQKLGLQID